MPNCRHAIRLSLVALPAFGLAACFGKTYWTPSVRYPSALSTAEPARPDSVKIHLTSGDLWILHSWQSHPDARRLSGHGTQYDVARRPVDSGPLDISFDSIALVETHQRGVARPFGLSGLVVWTDIMAPVTVYCTVDPKACFGSCPTFYAPDSTGGESLQAEGFSSSFARALEATDLDALHRMPSGETTLELRMTNEAMETHAVRFARILAAPRTASGRVFATPRGTLLPADTIVSAARCSAPEGDCTASVGAFDGHERISPADSNDLAARETIDLVFPPLDGAVGIMLATRQSLLTTFLFYQTMAYFGHGGGEWLATLERGGPMLTDYATGMARVLGGVDILIDEDGEWSHAGTYQEAGPIAADVVTIPLPKRSSTDSVRIRLRLAKGAWRLDWVALARLGEPIEPVPIEPSEVLAADVADTEALESLRDTSRYLVTYPGDVYTLVFALPRSPHGLDLFLETRGYYYEWMRAEWMRETNVAMAQLALRDPAATLRLLAPAFKRAEPAMERSFWESRFGRSP